MPYIYDFKYFIDSPDISAYVTKDMFTLGEQAVLISQSKRTMKEKIQALEYLRETYPEIYYCSRTVCPRKECEKRTILLRDLISRTLDYWKAALDNSENSQGVVFAANLIEKGFPRNHLSDYRLFSTYGQAYEYLTREKQDYMEDDDLKEVITYGEIRRIPLDKFKEGTNDFEQYFFNNSLELIRVLGTETMDWKNVQERSLTDFYVYVPVPFKKGDEVKVDLEEAGDFFGVIPWDISEDQKHQMRICETGDSSDMIISIDYRNVETGEWFMDHASVLSLMYAKKENS